MGDIEGDGEREWEREEGEGIRRTQQEETNEPEKHEREGESVPGEKETGERGVGTKKILPGRAGAEPRSDHTANTELEIEGGIRADEVGSSLPLVVEEGVLAHGGVKVSLLVTSDDIHGARVGIENLIVAGPEFEGKVRTERDKAVEACVVSDGPGQTAEEDDGER